MNKKYNKPIDILKFKSHTIEQLQKQALDTKSTSDVLFKEGNYNNVDKCPICNFGNRKTVAEIYGITYVECSICGHVYTVKSPKKEVLDEFYRESDYSKTYTDKDLAKARAIEIALPKIEFIKEQYFEAFGRPASSIFDVGAGGGHFVCASKSSGLTAGGLEISNNSCRFAKEIFDVDLIKGDVLDDKLSLPVSDIVSFIGVLEHVNYPNKFLCSALEKINKNAMVVIEVPRWNCISTTSQLLNKNNIFRHLVPCSHISIFSDKSLNLMLEQNGFKVSAAWYFGMDAYEIITNLAIMCGNDNIIKETKDHINLIQEKIDNCEMSDEILVCAKKV